MELFWPLEGGADTFNGPRAPVAYGAAQRSHVCARGLGLESSAKCAHSCSERGGTLLVLGGELIKNERTNELKLAVREWPVMASGPRKFSASRTGTAWLHLAQGPTENHGEPRRPALLWLGAGLTMRRVRKGSRGSKRH